MKYTLINSTITLDRVWAALGARRPADDTHGAEVLERIRALRQALADVIRWAPQDSPARELARELEPPPAARLSALKLDQPDIAALILTSVADTHSDVLRQRERAPDEDVNGVSTACALFTHVASDTEYAIAVSRVPSP